MRYRFKRAETAAEFEQIARLNHEIFADELHQYAPDPSGAKVDKFHDKNLYVIALAGGDLAAMIALHDQPPFSVAEKLADPSVLSTLGRVIELRLLAIRPEHRSGSVLRRLLAAAFDHVLEYDTMVISGVVDKAEMYRGLGFRDLGPPVRSGGNEFIPMASDIRALKQRHARWKQGHV